MGHNNNIIICTYFNHLTLMIIFEIIACPLWDNGKNLNQYTYIESQRAFNYVQLF